MVEKTEEKSVMRIVQLSDLHITGHNNLLEPMIQNINSESVDLVVVTGDVVHESTKELLTIASDTLNKIRHKVIVIPGDYDNGPLWKEFFGTSRLSSVQLGDYNLDFIDTSFMKHRFFVGWGDVLKQEDPEQCEWLLEQLKIDSYHILFSHHPFWVIPSKAGDKFLTNNVRAVYSGHLHEIQRIYFKYTKPRKHFTNGFITTALDFHGSSSYLIIQINSNDEIVNIPRIINPKQTAW